MCLVLGPPRPEPALQLIQGGWRKEDQHGVGLALLHLPGSLDVDLQDDGLPPGSVPLDGFGERPRPVVTKDVRPLQEGVIGDQTVEIGVGDEPVIRTLCLARPRRACGSRDRQHDVGTDVEDPANDGALADARRSGDDEQPAARGMDLARHVPGRASGLPAVVARRYARG